MQMHFSVFTISFFNCFKLPQMLLKYKFLNRKVSDLDKYVINEYTSTVITYEILEITKLIHRTLIFVFVPSPRVSKGYAKIIYDTVTVTKVKLAWATNSTTINCCLVLVVREVL